MQPFLQLPGVIPKGLQVGGPTTGKFSISAGTNSVLQQPRSAPALISSSQPLLQPPSPAFPPNCVTIAGLPWFFTETEVRLSLAQFGLPKLLRLYEDPLNGCSRGIVLVGFEAAAALIALQQQLRMIGPYPVSVAPWHLSTRWNPSLAPPSIPGDPFYSTVARGGNIFGFGPSELEVRGVCLGEANTCTSEGMTELENARKKYRRELDLAEEELNPEVTPSDAADAAILPLPPRDKLKYPGFE